MHLMNKPGFAPGGPDWTLDSHAEFLKYIRYIHDPYDIISVHIYPGANDIRFGRKPGQEYLMVDDAIEAAKTAGKKLDIGEFGDAGLTPYLTGMLSKIVGDGVDYSSIWIWEYYQTATFQTRNNEATRFSVEPSYSANLIKSLMATEKALGHPAPLNGDKGTPGWS